MEHSEVKSRAHAAARRRPQPRPAPAPVRIRYAEQDHPAAVDAIARLEGAA